MAKSMYFTISCTMIAITVLLTACSGSAIPMWEYLSRGEKMSHLYSMFAKQVNTYCKTNGDIAAKPQCKRDLLMYGLGKLQGMSETHLDAMDPYQRGATDIIWDSMMDGHVSSSVKSSTTFRPILMPTGGEYAKNPLFDNVPEPNYHQKSPYSDSVAMEMDAIYTNYQYPPSAAENTYDEPANDLPQETIINVRYAHPTGTSGDHYLSGPMVVRVRPDGTPVDTVKPKDDDEMQIGKEKLPTFEQLSGSFGTTKNLLTENGHHYKAPTTVEPPRRFYRLSRRVD